MVEGDMIVEDLVVEVGEVEDEDGKRVGPKMFGSHRRSKRAATTRLWPSQGTSVIVPYVFGSSVRKYSLYIIILVFIDGAHSSNELSSSPPTEKSVSIKSRTGLKSVERLY